MTETIKKEVAEATEEKDYELRGLEAKDISAMTSIMSKIGIREFKRCFGKEEIKAITAMLSGDEGMEISVESIGISIFIDAAGIILEHYEKAETEIHKLLAALSGKTVEEIESLSLVTFTEMVVDVVQKEEFKGFMKVVSKLFK